MEKIFHFLSNISVENNKAFFYLNSSEGIYDIYIIARHLDSVAKRVHNNSNVRLAIYTEMHAAPS